MILLKNVAHQCWITVSNRSSCLYFSTSWSHRLLFMCWQNAIVDHIFGLSVKCMTLLSKDYRWTGWGSILIAYILTFFKSFLCISFGNSLTPWRQLYANKVWKLRLIVSSSFCFKFITQQLTIDNCHFRTQQQQHHSILKSAETHVFGIR